MTRDLYAEDVLMPSVAMTSWLDLALGLGVGWVLMEKGLRIILYGGYSLTLAVIAYMLGREVCIFSH